MSHSFEQPVLMDQEPPEMTPEPPPWDCAAGEAAAPLPEPPVSEERAAPLQPLTSPGIPDATWEKLETIVTTGFTEVLGEFRDKLALDRFREDQISKLHEELQSFRNNLVLRTVRQVLQGLVRLHDDFGKVMSSLQMRPIEELTPDRLLQYLAGFQDDVELLLGQHGVERFESDGEEFDPYRQTALRTVPTDNPGLVGRIAERLRPGFEQAEAILQKERVAVYTPSSSTNQKA